MKREADAGARRIEWTIGILSALLTAVILTMLVYEGLTRTDGFPRLYVTAEPTSDETHVRYVLRNDGQRAASNVHVTALIRDTAGEILNERAIEIDHVPAGSSESGGFHVPARTATEFVIDGYVDP